MSEKIYLSGFDVGGTKIDAVLFTPNGHVVARVSDIGGNPLELGFDVAASLYLDALKKLYTYAEDGRVAALYGSVAATEYFGDDLQNFLAEQFDVDKVRIEGDGPCMISGMLGHRDGAALVCGTGSSLYFRNGETYSHIGGWGHLIDSCGSGYVLGRFAIQAALRSYDGRYRSTVLCDLLEEKCGKPIWENMIEVYNGGRRYIASFAETLFKARNLGDAEAVKIFNSCAADLSDLVNTAFRMMQKPFDLVFNGGIFTHFPEYAEAVKAGCPRDVNVIFSDTPPIYGCAVEALHDIGIDDLDKEYKANFMREYNALKA